MARALKICCIALAIILAIFAVTAITLALTIFKLKQPEITATPVGLGDVQFGPSPNGTLNVTIGMLVTIENPNYSGFQYENSTAHINYRGTVVGDVLLEQRYIPAHTTVNITTFADLMTDKLISTPGFLDDFLAGHLDMVSTAKLPGKVSMLKIMRFRATTYSTCQITFNVQSQSANSKCVSRIKL